MELTHFKSRKDPLFGVVILGTALMMLFVLFTELNRDDRPENEVPIWGLVIFASVVVFMLWLWFDTRYYLDSAFVYFRSGPFRGKIRVSSIREVVMGATMWSGFKPALARNGVVVKYNRYDEIYFSPDDNETFATALLNLNPQIRIVNKEGAATR